MSYMVDKPPSEDPLLQRQVRSWEVKEHRPVLTFTRSAYKPYSTCVFRCCTTTCDEADCDCRTKNKYSPWQPKAIAR